MNKKEDDAPLFRVQMSELCDLFVRDKSSGRIHRVGSDKHDGLWVDDAGTVHYQNLQNGDGCSANSRNDPLSGYEFVPSDFGTMEADGDEDVSGDVNGPRLYPCDDCRQPCEIPCWKVDHGLLVPRESLKEGERDGGE